jgi:adenosylmethionine-8-amino-7-oxononanoate aminotransferase
MTDNTQKNVLYYNFRKRYPTIIRGEGVYVYDENEKQYLDAIGGVCVVNVGHGVKEIADAVADQAHTLAYTYSGETDNLPRQMLGEKLKNWVPQGMGDAKFFFCSGGAEANEAAIKLAYQHHWERGNTAKVKVIGRWQSYHGNTIGTLSAGGRTAWRTMHDPYLLDFPHIPPPYCYRCPWDRTYPDCGIKCAYELERVITQEGSGTVSAFIAEPVVGTSLSALVPPQEYYPIVREICDRYDVLLIVDEVMSGVGRTGAKWAIEHWGVAPDILTSAKGISGGYAPLGMAMLSEKVWKAIASGSQVVMHSYTFGGNPLSCRAAAATLDYIEKHGLIEQAKITGASLKKRLQEELGDLPNVGEIRGLGLFLGVELVKDHVTKEPFPPEWNVTTLVEEQALENGLFVLGGVGGMVNGVAGDHIELVPPYTIEEGHVDFIAETLRKSILYVVDQLPDG